MSSQLVVPQFKIVVPAAQKRQEPILDSDARFKIIAAGRRWGKTTTGLIAAIVGHGPIQTNGMPLYPGAIYGRKIWWVAPTYTHLNDIWRNLKVAVADATIYKNENEHRVEIPGGGSITVRSTEIYDNLRGPGVDGLLLDEAAYINGKAWTLVLRPMLTDRQGWAIFMSTPQGKNWWYDMYERAATAPGWRRWHAPSTDNPVMTEEEVASVKSEPGMTEAYFAQEYLAQFNSPGINPFRSEWFKYYTYDYETDEYVIYPRDSRAGKYLHPDGTDFSQDEREQYDALHPEELVNTNQEEIKRVPVEEVFKFVTVDLAISTKDRADYTVMQVWGSTPAGDLILIHQVRGRMENPEQLETLKTLHEEYNPTYLAIERAGYQLALIQQAKREGLPVDELKADKDKISRAATAVTMMSKGKIIFPKDAEFLPALKDEVASFPHGHNDDQVDAMAYAAIKQSQRPRKMMFKAEDIEYNDTVFCLADPTLGKNTLNNPILPETTNAQPIYQNNELLRQEAVWETERGPIALAISVEHLLATLSHSFRGDYSSMYHVHIAVSKQSDYAAIALGRIERWDQVFAQAEQSAYAIQVPFFEVPMLLKIGSQMGETISNSVITDFIIALKGIRGFNITSASVTGIKSATAVQKLTRADIAVLGLQIDTATGIPTGIAKSNVESDTQPYIDLKLAIENYRLAVVDSQFLKHELLQIEDTGKTLAHDSTAADALAHTVGFLAKYGHQIMESPNESYVPMESLGFERYTGLQVDYND